jgi:hypothetical protein
MPTAHSSPVHRRRADPAPLPTHRPPPADSAATSPTAGSRSSAPTMSPSAPNVSGSRSRSTGQRSSRGYPGRAYTIAEPLPATMTAARGRRSQITGCESVGTPWARNQSARSRWVCTPAAP